jgi:hypothetical protein
MSALTRLAEKVEAGACEICNGDGKVKVGWSQVMGSTYKIKIEYDPCPNCQPSPHSFHALQVMHQIRALAAEETP